MIKSFWKCQGRTQISNGRYFRTATIYEIFRRIVDYREMVREQTKSAELHSVISCFLKAHWGAFGSSRSIRSQVSSLNRKGLTALGNFRKYSDSAIECRPLAAVTVNTSKPQAGQASADAVARRQLFGPDVFVVEISSGG